MNLQPLLNLTDPNHPPEIVTRTSEEFYAALARADEWVMREKSWVQVRRGEFAVEFLTRVTGTNGGWRIRVRWNDE